MLRAAGQEFGAFAARQNVDIAGANSRSFGRSQTADALASLRSNPFSFDLRVTGAASHSLRQSCHPSRVCG